MKNLFYCLIIILTLSGCGTSLLGKNNEFERAALVATESPSSTPEPTKTPLPTSTATVVPSPTPDTRVINIDPANLMLGKPDLPEELKYYIPPKDQVRRNSWYDTRSGTYPQKNPRHVAYMWTNQAAADVYLNETGRIYGYVVMYYRKGNPKSDYPAEIYDEVSLFRTSAGAEKALDIWGDRVKFINQNWKSFEELPSPMVGDASRLMTYTITTYDRSDPETRRAYYLIFSVRNITHYMFFYGREGQLEETNVVEIGNTIASKMYEAELSEEVTFAPK